MKHILVVDDDAAVRSAFTFALDDTPCQVVVASSGAEGLARFKEGTFDLVVTDLRMPGMNGVELLDEIRKIDPQVPLRMITAFAQEFLVEIKAAIQEGRNFELIRKPLERADIRTFVCSVLDINPDESGATESVLPSKEQYTLRLYITGETQQSVLALKNIEEICKKYLEGRYRLDVIDIFREPCLAADDRIIATPTLIKELPDPLQKIIGDLSDREKVLLGLDIKKV